MTNSKVLICVCVLCLLQGCASNEHLLFFTNSSIGVDISVEQGQTPVKFIVGYKRQEGVLDPIGQGYAFQNSTFMNRTTASIKNVVITKDGYFYPKGVKDEAHSVIAKMNFGATGGGSAETSAAQWFATGKAAEELAKNPSTPAAMAGDARISPILELNTTMGKQVRANTIYLLAYKQLVDYINEDGRNDAEAIKIKQSVDDLDDGEFNKTYKMFIIKDNKIEEKNFPLIVPGVVQTKSFANVANYLTELNASINNAIEIDSNTVKKSDNAKLTDTERKVITEDMLKYKQRLVQLTWQISNNKNVIKMLSFAIFNSK